VRFLVVLVLLAASGAAAQPADRDATERRLASLRQQIEGVEERIADARTEEEGALTAIQEFDREIALREELVAGYRTQLEAYRRETQALQASIRRLEAEIEQAREAYRRRAVHAYKRGHMETLAVILSSGSIPQMIARVRYLRQFTQRRRRQVERVATKTLELRERQAALTGSVRSTQALLLAGQAEQTELAERRREREALVAQARRRRTTLEAQLTQQRADARRMEALVAEIVAAERRRAEEARRRREEEERRRRLAAEAAEAARRAEAMGRGEVERRTRPNPRNPARPTPAPATPAPTRTAPETASPPAEDRFESLTGSFRANRGRLPWPADGTVTGAFGTRTDPVYGTRTDSPGIDISTAAGAGVRAVFEGTVERVGAMAAFGTFVLISHGEYTTLYGNLSAVNVRQGQRIRAGQTVGRAGTNSDRRGAAVFFAVFEGGSAVNPTGWLRGR